MECGTRNLEEHVLFSILNDNDCPSFAVRSRSLPRQLINRDRIPSAPPPRRPTRRSEGREAESPASTQVRPRLSPLRLARLASCSIAALIIILQGYPPRAWTRLHPQRRRRTISWTALCCSMTRCMRQDPLLLAGWLPAISHHHHSIPRTTTLDRSTLSMPDPYSAKTDAPYHSKPVSHHPGAAAPCSPGPSAAA